MTGNDNVLGVVGKRLTRKLRQVAQISKAQRYCAQALKLLLVSYH
jgi:hypothetical protein